jgi:iron complex outermembrane recepter protein
VKYRHPFFFVALLLASASSAADAPTALGEITVTGTREGQARSETPATVSVISEEAVREVAPAHPSELMGRVPGVHVNVTGGEGHATAIRQPITTAPVYLFLEDGIPTRSTGFFNHNALYEVNVPQAGGVEVLKGPGTALYGSDAIGGVVNVLTRPAPLTPEAELRLEGGEHGWVRLLGSAGNTWGEDGLRADLNLTRTDGWREATGYERQSATLRWDRFFESGAALKTVLSASNIDQETAGSSRLSREDYLDNPTLNYTPISFREVRAVRLSTAYERESARSLLSITPYLRYNEMDLLANWTLASDPSVSETGHASAGLLLKYRRDFAPLRTRLIVGADLDYSPGSRFEQSITTTRDGRVFTAYAINETIYDYDVTFMAASPYVHLELSPLERLRLTGGLRYDAMRYDYDNKLGELTTGRHRRPASTKVDFRHLSPKLGLTYAFTPVLNGFAAYSHAFRVPSEGQLFRQGSAANTVDLEPVKADNYELGLRGQLGKVTWETSVYYMVKKDDILTFTHPDDTRETVNAGETLHRGFEAALGAPLTRELRFDLAYSRSRHTFEEWVTRTGTDFSGKEMSSAPRSLTNARLGYRPARLQGAALELEWQRVGSYWLDDENTARYDGHDLFNLRGSYAVTKRLELDARVANLADERYATAAALSRGQEEFAPGLPRTYYVGLTYRMP